MGYAAKKRRFDRRFNQWVGLNSLSAILSDPDEPHKSVGRMPTRQIRKPRRHVYKFREPSFKGEPWFLRKNLS